MNTVFEQVDKLLQSGVKQITLTRKQAETLVNMAKRLQNEDTQRLRLASYRAASELRAVADRLDKERVK